MPRALVVGGTSAIGRATAHRLLASGWSVDLAGRNPARMPADLVAAGARFIQADRDDTDQMRAAYGAGADLLVDNVCYTASQARGVLPFARDAGSIVMLSSKAVYVDAAGNHPNSDVAPRFEGPINESQPTMEPSDIDFNSREGYGANKVAAEHVLLDSGVPVTIIRPSKVHGPGALRPREWTFVKRVLDRRPVVLLANGGRGGDHPTAAANIAALIEVVAARPGQRILNSADPDTPSAAEIARIIAAQLGHKWEEVLLDEAAPEGLGETPWDLATPDRPRHDRCRTVGLHASRRLRVHSGGGGRVARRRRAGRAGADSVPADDDPFFARLLDYAAEDAYLARRG